MIRSRTSLKRRTLGAAVLTMVVCIPLIAWALERAFVSSLTQALFEQMRIHGLTLISEFEYVNGETVMPEHLATEEFNLPDSGLYAFITSEDKTLWQSESTTLMESVSLFSPTVGQYNFEKVSEGQHDYFRFAYTAEFETLDDYRAVSFHVVRDAQMFQTELDEFRGVLWYWLSFVTLILFALLVFSLNQALKPIGQLIRQIEKVEGGQQKRLEKRYPKELEQLKERLNQLLDNEALQRERYKNSLSDLAHSLKTPLAVLTGDTNLPTTAQEPLNQLESIISRQLKRAIKNSDDNWVATTRLSEVIPQLVSAMNKIHADKGLVIQLQGSTDVNFPMDKTDITEVLGNLFDNACKAATSKVLVTTQANQERVSICIDDDGQGIPESQRQRLLARGARLDSYKEGQGIGLTVTMDILAAYKGELTISDSPLGGARLELSVPFPA